MKNEKNHAQFHTARPIDRLQTGNEKRFRSATVVYGFLTDFGTHSPGQMGRFDCKPAHSSLALLH